MKNVVTFTEKERDELVLDIVSDAIIFDKVATAMNLMQRASDPGAEDWLPRDHYESYFNALPLMGFPFNMTLEQEKEILPIRNVLSKIFDTTVAADDRRENPYKRKAGELAKEILEEWKTFLNALEMKKAG